MVGGEQPRYCLDHSALNRCTTSSREAQSSWVSTEGLTIVCTERTGGIVVATASDPNYDGERPEGAPAGEPGPEAFALVSAAGVR